LAVLGCNLAQFYHRNALFSGGFVETDSMIDIRHPLAVLSSRMPWHELEASVSHLFANRVRAGKVINEAELFGGSRSPL
jgi:hypothetical protein